MKDPRSTRRYKELSASFIEQAKGNRVLCCLCGEPVDMQAPRTSPKGATIEHTLAIRHIRAQARSFLEAVDLACDASLWKIAHFRCQSQQGGLARTETQRFVPSLDWFK